MKTFHVASVCLALALGACSNSENGATPTVPNTNGGGISAQAVSSEAAATSLILVANEGAGTGGSIAEFSETASGNVAPRSVIAKNFGIPGPSAVGFSAKEGIAIADGNIDSSGLVGAETFALSTGDFLTGITCFGKPSQTNAVAFDSRGQLFVSAFLSEGGRAVEVFAPGATNCARPQRTISDAGGLAIDSNDLLYVANSTSATIDIFPSGSGVMQAQIGGSNTGLSAPGTVAVDASRNVYVFDRATSVLSEFAAGATGNVAPIRTITGSKTGLAGGDGFNFGLAVSKASGDIFVSNSATNAILVFGAAARGNVAPIHTIAGSATGLSVPLGLALTD